MWCLLKARQPRLNNYLWHAHHDIITTHFVQNCFHKSCVCSYILFEYVRYMVNCKSCPLISCTSCILAPNWPKLEWPSCRWSVSGPCPCLTSRQIRFSWQIRVFTFQQRPDTDKGQLRANGTLVLYGTSIIIYSWPPPPPLLHFGWVFFLNFRKQLDWIQPWSNKIDPFITIQYTFQFLLQLCGSSSAQLDPEV